jgi:lipid-A-disaccharide synthase-like uncharacterized protein
MTPPQPRQPHKKKRLKWEPAALMVLVLSLGLWIAFGPASRPVLPIHEQALTQAIRIGDERGVLEAYPVTKEGPGAEPQFHFRVLFRNSTSIGMKREDAEAIFGKEVVQKTIDQRRNVVFKWMNITSWVGVVWLFIGLLGQIAFSGRMVLQWITSERRRQSVITESFWWFSLAGSLLLFSYFAWRQEPIGLLGQASGIVIYIRNLRLIYKQRRRLLRGAGVPPAVPDPEGGAGFQPAESSVMSDPAPEPSLDTRNF